MIAGRSLKGGWPNAKPHLAVEYEANGVMLDPGNRVYREKIICSAFLATVASNGARAVSGLGQGIAKPIFQFTIAIY